MSDSVRSAVLAGLKTALEAIKTDTDYPIRIKAVSEFEENLNTTQPERSVLVMAIDTGIEQLQAQDSTHYRYALEVSLRGFVEVTSPEVLPTKLNNTLAAIKKFLDATPGSEIDPACKAIYYIEGDEINYDKNEGRNPRAAVLIRAQLIYVCTAGSF